MCKTNIWKISPLKYFYIPLNLLLYGKGILTGKVEANINFKDKEELTWIKCSVNLKALLTSDMNLINYFSYKSQIVFYMPENKPQHCHSRTQ